MKRLFLLAAVLLCVFSIWSSDFNVCVYPSDVEIEDYITRFFPVIDSSVRWTESVAMRQEKQSVNSAGSELKGAWNTENADLIEKADSSYRSQSRTQSLAGTFDVRLVKYNGKADEQGLKNHDPMLLQYICSTAKADLLIIPLSERMSGVNALSVCVYSPLTGNTEQVFFRLLQNSNVFSEEAAVALAPYFLTGEKLDSFTTVKPQVIRPILAQYTVRSNVPALVYLNGTEKGTTPLVLDNVPIPSVVRLTAEGYADSVINIDGTASDVNEEMKPAWMNEGEFYSRARHNFYRDMAITLGAFALKVGVRSLPVNSTNLQNTLNIGTDTLVVLSAFKLISGLFNYFMSADYLSK